MFKVFLFFMFLAVQAKSVINTSEDSKCEGFPKVTNFKTTDSTKCLGVSLAKGDVPWIKPRRMVFKNKNTILVTDMGGWSNRSAGVLWEVNLKTKAYRKIYEGGDWTHGLALDSQGRVLIGDADKIVRIEHDGTLITVIGDLPSHGSHPISHFIILPNQDIVLNIGAPSNDCSETIRGFHCRERESYGELRLYKYRSRQDAYDRSAKRIARGLRNSMALLYNEELEFLYQAENNLDQPGVPEEFNQIPMDRWFAATDFGWPFCHGFGEQYLFPIVDGERLVAPNTFRTFCAEKAEKPLFLVPAHSSPLDMMYYRGKAHPNLNDKILMSWHGHRREVEYSLVAYDTDSSRHPVYEGEGYGSYIGLTKGVSISSAKDKIRPVGLAVDHRGLIWMVDDVNKAIIVYGNFDGSSTDEDEVSDYESRVDSFIFNLSDESKSIFNELYDEFYNTNACSHCHGEAELPSDSQMALKTLFLRGWLDLDVGVSRMNMMRRMSKESVKPMPPTGAFEVSEPEVYKKLEDWLRSEL